VKRAGFLIILIAQIIYAKVTVNADNIASVVPIDKISNNNLEDSTFYVSGDAYVYGLTEVSKAKVVYSYKKDKNKLKQILNKKIILAGKKKIKNIQKKPIKATNKEIKINTAGGSVYFSQLQSAGAVSFLPTKLSEIAGLIKIEEFRSLFFYNDRGKILQLAILFSHGIRIFRFCRPPPFL